MKAIRLDNLVDKWIKNHPDLKGHFKVYRITTWDHYNHEWPEVLGDDGITSFVGMACDGIGVALAIESDHVYYRNTDKTPKVKFMAADIDFFEKVAHDLTTFHRKVHKNRKCNISV